MRLKTDAAQAGGIVTPSTHGRRAIKEYTRRAKKASIVLKNFGE
jgi:hypothetical protein